MFVPYIVLISSQFLIELNYDGTLIIILHIEKYTDKCARIKFIMNQTGAVYELKLTKKPIKCFGITYYIYTCMEKVTA